MVVNPDTALFKICFILFCCIFSFFLFLCYFTLVHFLTFFFYVLSILPLYSLLVLSLYVFLCILPQFFFLAFSFWATRPPDLGLLAPTYKQEQDHQDMEAIFLLTLLPFTHGGCEAATVRLTTTRYNASVQSAFLAIHLGNSACGLVFSDDTVDFL